MLFESEIASFCSTHKYVIITGDFNAQTAEMKNYTENDDFLSELFDFDPKTVEFSHILKNLKSMMCYVSDNPAIGIPTTVAIS